MKRSICIIFLAFITLLLVGCGSAEETGSTTTYPTPESMSAPTMPASEVYPPPGAMQEAQPTDRPMFPYPGPYPYPYPGYNPQPRSVQPTIDYSSLPYIPPNSDPTSTPTAAVPVVVPTPNSSSGIVTGTLLSSDPGNPPYSAILYLGNTIQPDKAGFPPMVSLSPETDPKGTQDESGAFVFIDIKPGLYALIVWDPFNSVVVQDEKKENYLTFEVKAGEITDLGTILYP